MTHKAENIIIDRRYSFFMKITLSFTETEINNIILESATFRELIIKELFKTDLVHENSLINGLKLYIQNTFNSSTKISAIKYVRQFVEDNKTSLSYEKYNDLYSLAGAKKFVEENILS